MAELLPPTYFPASLSSSVCNLSHDPTIPGEHVPYYFYDIFQDNVWSLTREQNQIYTAVQKSESR